MRMQVCDCLVQLGGDTASITTPKFNVTVAEALLLNRMHGKGLTNNISRMHNFRTIEQSPVREKQRLVRLYHLGPQDPDEPGVVDKLFPGLAPQFPGTFAEVGLGEEYHGLPFPKHDPHADRAVALAEEEFEYIDEAAGMSLEEAALLPEPERQPEEEIEVTIERPGAPKMSDGDLGLSGAFSTATAPDGKGSGAQPLTLTPEQRAKAEKILAKAVGA